MVSVYETKEKPSVCKSLKWIPLFKKRGTNLSHVMLVKRSHRQTRTQIVKHTDSHTLVNVRERALKGCGELEVEKFSSVQWGEIFVLECYDQPTSTFN